MKSIIPLKDRLLAKRHIDPVTGCWNWTGTKPNGYGQIRRGSRRAGLNLTHIASYEIHVGPVPEGLELDHLCRNPACFNPDHLEAVTHSVNVKRGTGGPLGGMANAMRCRAITHCKRGHEYNSVDTYFRGNQRVCRPCRAVREGRRYASTTSNGSP